MRARLKQLVVAGALLAAAAAGCFKHASTNSTGDDPTQQLRAAAEQYFTDSVYPSMNQECGTCHATTSTVANAPHFVTATATDTYNLVEQTPQFIDVPAKSPLVTYIHKDTSISPSGTLRQLILNWLTAEANGRGLISTASKVTTLTDAYSQFAACMSQNQDLWSVEGMDNVPYTQTDTAGPCFSCHSEGQGNAWLADDQSTFLQMQQFPWVEKLVVGTVDGNGHFASLVPARRFALKSLDQCPDGAKFCHPTYGLPPEVEAAIDNFVNITLQDMLTGNCGAVPVQPMAVADAGDGGG